MSTLYILQGVPGSGKSWLARMMRHGRPDLKVCSTDDYFYDEQGRYQFDPSKLADNHARNLAKAKFHMDFGETVVVDNTCIRRWEAREYVKHAVACGIPVVFIRVTGNFKSVHGVPEEKIASMRASLEELTVESVLASKTPWELASPKDAEKLLEELGDNMTHASRKLEILDELECRVDYISHAPMCPQRVCGECNCLKSDIRSVLNEHGRSN